MIPRTDGERIAAQLHRLVHQVGSADGGAAPTPADLAGRAVALARRRRQRDLRWAAAALAVVLLGTGASLTRPADVPSTAPASTQESRASARESAPESAPAAVERRSAPPDLYLRPARGSLAGDRELLTELAERRWSAVSTDSGATQVIEPDTRRVVYAADVPGGHRWAVALARYDDEWAVNWFTGPAGAEPEQMREAYVPITFHPEEPLALMDVSAATGPLLVLTGTDRTVEYSPSLDRAADGSLGRTFTPLPMVDGVPLGVVTTPVTWGAEQVVEGQGATRRQVGLVLTTGTPPWVRTDIGSGPFDQVEFATCLTEFGFWVDQDPDGVVFSYSDPQPEQLSSAEQAVRDRLVDECILRASDD